MFFWKRGCCCKGTNASSCGCGGGYNTGDLECAEFPPTFTITYVLWSLGAHDTGGLSGYNSDSSFGTYCDPSDTTTYNFLGHCGECATWGTGRIQDKYVAGSEIYELSVTVTVVMTLQDGTYPGYPAPECCTAWYAGTVTEGVTGPSADSLGCDCATEYDFAGFSRGLSAKMSLTKQSPNTKIRLDIHDGVGWAPGDPPTPPPTTVPPPGDNDLLYEGIGGDLGEDLNGNTNCGYCYFPWDAFHDLTLIAGGQTYPGPPPAANGSVSMTQSYGNRDEEHFCCNQPPELPVVYFPIQVDLWNVYYWNLKTVAAYGHQLPLFNTADLTSGCLMSAEALWGYGANQYRATAICYPGSSWADPPDYITPCYAGLGCVSTQAEDTKCVGPSTYNGSKGYGNGLYRRLSWSILA